MSKYNFRNEQLFWIPKNGLSRKQVIIIESEYVLMHRSVPLFVRSFVLPFWEFVESTQPTQRCDSLTFFSVGGGGYVVSFE